MLISSTRLTIGCPPAPRDRERLRLAWRWRRCQWRAALPLLLALSMIEPLGCLLHCKLQLLSAFAHTPEAHHHTQVSSVPSRHHDSGAPAAPSQAPAHALVPACDTQPATSNSSGESSPPDTSAGHTHLLALAVRIAVIMCCPWWLTAHRRTKIALPRPHARHWRPPKLLLFSRAACHRAEPTPA
jgi:hypothetical protein